MIHSLLAFIKSLHSPEGLGHIVQNGGLLALILIVFSETGLLVGFFLPGDSLLVTAGIFAAGNGAGGPPLFNIFTLSAVLSIAAIVGDQLGFLLGRKSGPLIFSKEDSLFFKRKHVQSAHDFYEKHGPRALILARFVPILRTFVPFIAGVANMNYKHFVRYNVIGGFLWIWAMLWLGYGLGQTPLANDVHKIIVVVVFLSVLPIMISTLKRLCRKPSKA